MVLNLIRTLELFKQERLGDVLSFSNEDEFLANQKKFKKLVGEKGEGYVRDEMIKRTSGRLRTLFHNRRLRDIVMSPVRHYGYPTLIGCKGVGRDVLPVLERELYKMGLHLGMTEAEVRGIFPDEPNKKDKSESVSMQSSHCW